MTRFLIVALGAALGANARYLLGLWAASRFGVSFPYGTLIVNVAGSFLLGFFLAVTTERLSISTETRLLLIVGFFGSFTTFSSYSVESLTLLRASGWWSAFLNIAGNNLLALIAALLGSLAARVVG